MTTKSFLQKKLHFQNFIVVAFLTKNSVFGRFCSLPPRPPAPQKCKFLFLLSSLAISETIRKQLLCVSFVCAATSFTEELLCALFVPANCTLGTRNYTKEFLPEIPV